jgi:hypothetical protein
VQTNEPHIGSTILVPIAIPLIFLFATRQPEKYSNLAAGANRVLSEILAAVCGSYDLLDPRYLRVTSKLSCARLATAEDFGWAVGAPKSNSRRTARSAKAQIGRQTPRPEVIGALLSVGVLLGRRGPTLALDRA